MNRALERAKNTVNYKVYDRLGGKRVKSDPNNMCSCWSTSLCILEKSVRSTGNNRNGGAYIFFYCNPRVGK